MGFCERDSALIIIMKDLRRTLSLVFSSFAFKDSRCQRVSQLKLLENAVFHGTKLYTSLFIFYNMRTRNRI